MYDRVFISFEQSEPFFDFYRVAQVCLFYQLDPIYINGDSLDINEEYISKLIKSCSLFVGLYGKIYGKDLPSSKNSNEGSLSLIDLELKVARKHLKQHQIILFRKFYEEEEIHVRLKSMLLPFSKVINFIKVDRDPALDVQELIRKWLNGDVMLGTEMANSNNSLSDLNSTINNKNEIIEADSYKASILNENDNKESSNLINIFIAFAQEDQIVRDKLLRQMSLVKGWNVWSAKEILAGEIWDEEIRHRLIDSDIVILLLSPDFFHSKYIVETEIPIIIERHQLKKCRIIPVIARLCHWKETPFGEYIAKLGDIQALPSGEKPILSKGEWDSEDHPYYDVVQGIKNSSMLFTTRNELSNIDTNLPYFESVKAIVDKWESTENRGNGEFFMPPKSNTYPITTLKIEFFDGKGISQRILYELVLRNFEVISCSLRQVTSNIPVIAEFVIVLDAGIHDNRDIDNLSSQISKCAGVFRVIKKFEDGNW